MASLNEPVDVASGNMATNMIKCGEGSKIQYSSTITLSPGELNRLAALDYSQYSTADYDKHVKAPNVVDPYQSALEEIPERFRINVEFKTSYSATLT